MSADPRKLKGRAAETVAAEELERRGYRIRERNYRCPEGEADLVADDGEDLVFVEVKARSGFGFGLPREAVGSAKRRRLGRIAERYCRERAIEGRPVRFDVVEVILLRGEAAAVEVIRDAFAP